VTDTVLALEDGTVYELADVAAVYGEAVVGSTILVQTCTGADGNSTVRMFVLSGPDGAPDAVQVAVCHTPPGNPANAQTIAVPESALAAHLAHGDTIGTCMQQDGGEVAGDDNGDADTDGGNDGVDAQPEPQVTVCHVPAGSPANEQTISVGQSSVNAHLAHGDYMGACDGRNQAGNGSNAGNSGNNANSGNGGSNPGSNPGGGNDGNNGNSGTNPGSNPGGGNDNDNNSGGNENSSGGNDNNSGGGNDNNPPGQDKDKSNNSGGKDKDK
jgi:hypothetical protein